MIKYFRFYCFFTILSCSANRASKTLEMPVCLEAKIKSMQSDPNEGAPLSVTQYVYQNQKVYYVASPCCDKYNVVYDSVCNILGYPDGGYTGKGDGKMMDFFNEATDKKLVWQREK
jgi:hypothetical protein